MKTSPLAVRRTTDHQLEQMMKNANPFAKMKNDEKKGKKPMPGAMGKKAPPFGAKAGGPVKGKRGC